MNAEPVLTVVAMEETVHVLLRGWPLCGFSMDVPGKWPHGHSWVRAGEPEATCAECIEKEKTL